jgi:hypothetical protein
MPPSVGNIIVGCKKIPQFSKGSRYPNYAPNQISLASKSAVCCANWPPQVIPPTETLSSHPPTRKEESVCVPDLPIVCTLNCGHLLASFLMSHVTPSGSFTAMLVTNTLSYPNWVPKPDMSRRAL